MIGTDSLREFHRKYNSTVDHATEVLIYNDRTWYPGTGFESMVNKDNYETATDEAVDLINKMLVFDHEHRITARDAMKHPYFER